MSYSAKVFNSATRDEAKPIINLPIAHTQLFTNERLVQFIYALHASLDLKTIIQQFAQSIGAEIPSDGFTYSYDLISTSITIGKMGRHELNYDLTCGSKNLGKIIFSRNTAYTQNEILEL